MVNVYFNKKKQIHACTHDNQFQKKKKTQNKKFLYTHVQSLVYLLFHVDAPYGEYSWVQTIAYIVQVSHPKLTNTHTHTHKTIKLNSPYIKCRGDCTSYVQYNKHN